jgi:hypothetical protein
MPKYDTLANSTSTEHRPQLAKLLEQLDPPRARVIFAIDATASRQPTWDLARRLTGDMFKAVVVGSLNVQSIYFRGDRECIASPWMSDAGALSAIMADVECRQGLTQIERVLEHTKREHERQKVAALVLISDSCEEQATHLHASARALCDVPVFMFQEGSDEHVAHVYKLIANATGGAWARFDANAAQHLANLLKAVIAFATGGAKALEGQGTKEARLLLSQVKAKGVAS